MSESWSASRVITELFSAVMEVVSSEPRCGLPSDFLYADDLIFMSPIMEHIGIRVVVFKMIGERVYGCLCTK